MEIIKVSKNSNPNSVAGALTNIIKEKEEVEFQIVGAGSLNQLVKAIIISRGFLAPLGINIVCIPSFTEVFIDNTKKTGIKILVKKSYN